MKNNIISTSIKGTITIFPNNLKGISFDKRPNIDKIPLPVIKIKKTIIDNFIIPMHSNNWQSVKENYFLLDKIQMKINKYKNNYKNYDLDIYEHLVNFIKNHFNQHIENEELENKLYNTNNNNVATLFYKTPVVRLKAEYEIYNLIFGKPNKMKKETYNMSHIKTIVDLLKEDDITFDKIKNKMTNNL